MNESLYDYSISCERAYLPGLMLHDYYISFKSIDDLRNCE